MPFKAPPKALNSESQITGEGNPDCQQNLVEVGLKDTQKNLKLAADAGISQAQYELALLYLKAYIQLGKPPPVEEILKLVERAANQGLPNAQAELAKKLFAEKQLVKSYFWMSQAKMGTSNGGDYTSLVEQIKLRLTTEQIKEAENLLISWNPTKEFAIDPDEPGIY